MALIIFRNSLIFTRYSLIFLLCPEKREKLYNLHKSVKVVLVSVSFVVYVLGSFFNKHRDILFFCCPDSDGKTQQIQKILCTDITSKQEGREAN